MTADSNEFEAIVTAITEEIAVSKRRETRRGFIDYIGCRNVTNDFTAILDRAKRAADEGKYRLAYTITALMTENLLKLATLADDSGGSIRDTLYYAGLILEEICNGVEYGSEDAEYIFLQSIEDSQSSAFLGWDSHYNLLQKTARFATKENKQKLLALLEKLASTIDSHSFRDYDEERLVLIRIEVIKATGSDEEVGEYVNANLRYDGVRRIAVQRALEQGRFDEAEALCQEVLAESDLSLTRRDDWRRLLFEIYDRAKDRDKKYEMAMTLLKSGYGDFYDALKEIRIERGIWQSENEAFLEELSHNLPSGLFMSILAREGQTRRLYEELDRSGHYVFDYAEQLAAEFPQETYELCRRRICEDAAIAADRRQYRGVVALIEKLYALGGTAEALSSIDELKLAYIRRPAFLEELNRMAEKLTAEN